MKEVKRTELQKERGVWARHGDSISRSIQGEHSQMQKSIKLLLLDASSS